MRRGAELVRASQVYAKEDPVRTWTEFGATVAVYGTLLMGTALAPWWPLKLFCSVLLGLVTVRFFILYHDYMHGAIFRKSKLGKLLMYVVGAWTEAAPSVWKETHDYHHRNNAKLLGSSIGSYPLVTVNMWAEMSSAERFQYAATRHPLTILGAQFTAFALGMCIAPFRRNPRKHWQGPFVLLLWWATFGLLGRWLGWGEAFLLFMLPSMISSTLGSYLFYAQHNFPGAELRDRSEWEYTHAALRCSSMFEMSPWMHWFTGNIGYHHVHHLNHRIPFYRLPEAMAAIPELHDPVRTSWRPGDVWACLQIALWDSEHRRMVSFSEARELLGRRTEAA